MKKIFFIPAKDSGEFYRAVQDFNDDAKIGNYQDIVIHYQMNQAAGFIFYYSALITYTAPNDNV